jgi:uncharacterized protein (DUF302 family)
MTTSASNGHDRVVTTKVSTASVTETVQAFVAAITGRGIRVFAVIDQAAEAKAVGLDLRATTLVLYGAPAAGTPIMAADPLSALDLPLKLVVWDDEGTTKVSYEAPASLVGRLGLAAEMAAPISGSDRLVDAVLASEPGATAAP